MIKHIPESANRQAGVALVMVLWFVAAMSLLVTGIMGQAKLDIRLSQLYLRQAQAEALGDGAIQMAILDMLEKRRERSPQPSVPVLRDRWGDVEFYTEIRSASGFIEPNYASERMLRLLLERSAELEPEAAALLASRIVRWRTPLEENQRPEPGFRHGRFESPEDLLLVEGVTKDVYDKIEPAITVVENLGGRVNFMKAPPEVLQILAEDEALLEYWLDAQQSIDPGPVQAPADSDLVSSAEVEVYRVEARMRFSDNHIYSRVRWVAYGQRGRDGLPWRFLRSEIIARVNSLEPRSL